MAGLGLSKELCVICSGDWEGQTFCGVLGNLLGALSGHAGVARVLGSSGWSLGLVPAWTRAAVEDGGDMPGPGVFRG